MSKLLNRFNKTTFIGTSGVPAAGPSTYEPSIPRVALGVAGIAMTVITIAVSVILPAQMASGSREARMLASNASAAASMGLATVTRIDVVAVREPGSSTVQVRTGEAAPQSGRLGKTTSPAVIRVSSADH
jgi:hypothetical protein